MFARGRREQAGLTRGPMSPKWVPCRGSGWSRMARAGTRLGPGMPCSFAALPSLPSLCHSHPFPSLPTSSRNPDPQQNSLHLPPPLAACTCCTQELASLSSSAQLFTAWLYMGLAMFLIAGLRSLRYLKHHDGLRIFYTLFRCVRERVVRARMAWVEAGAVAGGGGRGGRGGGANTSPN